jgi:uncharacterized protein (DUF1697 family)
LDGPSGFGRIELVLTTYIELGLNELYVHYGEGMAQSKLKIPAAKTGTARNMNTVGKLAEMAVL